MISKTKKQLYKSILLYSCLGFFFYIVIPLFLSSKYNLKLINLFLIIYLPNFLAAYLLYYKHSHKISAIASDLQKLQESINLAEDEISRQKNLSRGVNLRTERYNSLKILIEKISQQFELELIAKSLLESVFELVGQKKGNCILYLVDSGGQRLNIYATKKENPNLVIKAKEGDIFDYWVLRHTSSLLIEDARKDFRFDSEATLKEYSRPILSLISAPLVSQERILGIMRVDSSDSHAFRQDDLRFLDTISDLGSIAIENARLFKETQELAIKDSLTSCYTRAYFLERLKEEFKRSARKKASLSLLMIDIDYFKKYNDKFGHIAGDILLKEISSLIREFFEPSHGFVSRYGGEEFCVLLANTDKHQASELAESLRKRVQAKGFILRQKKTTITISIGVAAFPADVSEEEQLIDKSDGAMYRAKESGRNKVCGS